MGNYTTLQEYRSISDIGTRLNEYIGVFDAIRGTQGEKIREMLSQNGETPAKVARKLKTTPANLTGLYKPKFSLSFSYLSQLCSKCLHCSCNEALLGEPAVVMLPKSITLLVKQLSACNERERQACVDYLKEICEMTFQMREDDGTPDLIRERLNEITHDRGVSTYSIFGNKMDTRAGRGLIATCMAGGTPQMNTVLLFAVELNYPIDYFIRRDYTENTTLQLYGDPQNCVDDADIVAFIGTYLKLPPQEQVKVFARVLNAKLYK